MVFHNQVLQVLLFQIFSLLSAWKQGQEELKACKQHQSTSKYKLWNEHINSTLPAAGGGVGGVGGRRGVGENKKTDKEAHIYIYNQNKVE